MLINFKNKISGGGGSCDLQEVEQTYTQNGVNEIIPDEGKDGISKATITVNVPDPYLVPLEVTENGSYNPQEGEDGYSSVNVQVQPKLEEKTVEIVKNGTENIIPTAGNDGISKITINTNVPQEGGLDFTGTGYNSEQQAKTNAEIQAALDYTAQKFAEWDPKNTTANGFYKNDKKLIFAPAIDLSNVNDINFLYSGCKRLITVPALNTSNTIVMGSSFNGCSTLIKISRMDVSKVVNMNNIFQSCSSLNEVHFTGGMKPDCNTNSAFASTPDNGTFFYDLPGDYTPIFKELPSSWEKQPLGDIPLKIRVLKDAVWMTGDQNLTLNGNRLTYKGQGLYEISENITKENYPTKSSELLLDGTKIGDVKWQEEEQIIETGDNSSLIVNKVGADVLTLVPEGGNVDGWAYDNTVKGVKSAKIGNNSSTTLKMNIPVNKPFDIVYGQDSESSYDYAKLLNGAGIEIVSFKGKKTGPDGQETYSGSTDDGVVQAVYRKDSSGDQGLDAFWIKSITWKNLPPYPTV